MRGKLSLRLAAAPVSGLIAAAMALSLAAAASAAVRAQDPVPIGPNEYFTAATTSILVTFTNFFVPTKIPTSVTVPCSGTGGMVFRPAPTSPTATSAVLPVTFMAGPAQ